MSWPRSPKLPARWSAPRSEPSSLNPTPPTSKPSSMRSPPCSDVRFLSSPTCSPTLASTCPGIPPKCGGIHYEGMSWQRRDGGTTRSFERGAVRIVRKMGKSIAEVAGDLDLNPGTLGNWVKKDQVERGESEGLTHYQPDQEHLPSTDRSTAENRGGGGSPLALRVEGGGEVTGAAEVVSLSCGGAEGLNRVEL